MTPTVVDRRSSDHDILIELRTEFRNFAAQYQIDMSELKDGTTKTLADHELRIKAVELKQRDRETKEKVVWALLSLLAGVIGFLINLAVKYLWPNLA